MDNGAEGTSWFWRLFGGTLIGSVVILLATLLNQMSSTQMELRAELARVHVDLTTLKEKSAENKQSTEGLGKLIETVREWQGRIQENLSNDEVKERVATIEEQITTMQEAQKELREKLKETQKSD